MRQTFQHYHVLKPYHQKLLLASQLLPRQRLSPGYQFPQVCLILRGLTCGLLRNKTDLASEPFPPNTCVSLPVDGATVKGTIKNVPLPRPEMASLPADPPTNYPPAPPNVYIIQLDNDTIVEQSYEQLVTT